MADSYPNRRFLVVPKRDWAHVPGELMSLGDIDNSTADWPMERVVWEALPKADMDALRALVVCAMKWRNDEPLSRSEFLAAFDAIPPSFLATVEKP